MDDTGLERSPFPNEKNGNHSESGAKSDASGAQSAILTEADDALRRLLAVWPKLTVEDHVALADDAESRIEP